MSAEWNDAQERQVQRLALCGYDFDCSRQLVLEVHDASRARAFLGRVLQQDWVAFGERVRDNRGCDQGGEDDRDPAVNIGFTYRGLQALGVPEGYMAELRAKAPAFCQGAPARAAHRLGDAGPSAAERWDPMFSSDRAHVLVSVHGPCGDAVDSLATRLADADGAQEGFKGWECVLQAEHLT